MRSPLSVLVGAGLVAALFHAGCQCGVSGTGKLLPDGGPAEHIHEPGPTHTGQPDASCALVSSEANTAIKPVDIIFVIDNSGSMNNELNAVAANINVNFAQIIGDSQLDYRVIMLSLHGQDFVTDQGYGICIKPPLSGNTECPSPPKKPINGPRYFHYDTLVGSHDSFEQILSTFNAPDTYGLAPNGWSKWLRSNSLKIFVEVTDDESSMSMEQFETKLFALSPHFGTASKRNYVFHSIVGIAANTPATAAFLPTDPMQTGECPTAEKPGEIYQKLSIATGGLRFPVCEGSGFDAVFRAVATSVVQGAEVSCDFEIPEPPQGSAIYVHSMEYTPGNGGPVQRFKQVRDLATCSTADSFFVANEKISLCPPTCSAVTKDTKAKISVFFSCDYIIN